MFAADAAVCAYHSVVRELTSVVSEPFEVFSPKLFRGMRESTPLTRHLAAQGLKVKLRTDTSVGRQSHSRRRASTAASGPSSPVRSMPERGSAFPPLPVGPAAGLADLYAPPAFYDRTYASYGPSSPPYRPYPPEVKPAYLPEPTYPQSAISSESSSGMSNIDPALRDPPGSTSTVQLSTAGRRPPSLTGSTYYSPMVPRGMDYGPPPSQDQYNAFTRPPDLLPPPRSMMYSRTDQDIYSSRSPLPSLQASFADSRGVKRRAEEDEPILNPALLDRSSESTLVDNLTTETSPADLSIFSLAHTGTSHAPISGVNALRPLPVTLQTRTSSERTGTLPGTAAASSDTSSSPSKSSTSGMNEPTPSRPIERSGDDGFPQLPWLRSNIGGAPRLADLLSTESYDRTSTRDRRDPGLREEPPP